MENRNYPNPHIHQTPVALRGVRYETTAIATRQTVESAIEVFQKTGEAVKSVAIAMFSLAELFVNANIALGSIILNSSQLPVACTAQILNVIQEKITRRDDPDDEMYYYIIELWDQITDNKAVAGLTGIAFIAIFSSPFILEQLNSLKTQTPTTPMSNLDKLIQELKQLLSNFQ